MLPAIFLLPKVIGALKLLAVGFGLMYVSSCVEDRIAGDIALQNEAVLEDKVEQVGYEAGLDVELEQSQVANEIEFMEEDKLVDPVMLGEEEGLKCYQISCVVE